MTGSGDRMREGRITALAELVRHPDPSQLWFQLAEIAGDRTYLRHGVELCEGDVVLDVGANVGVAAAFFASQCGAGLVHCFEPLPPLCELLRQNVGELPACVVHEFGLSSADGRADFTYYPDAGAMSGQYADPERDRAAVRDVMVNLGAAEDDAERQVDGRWSSSTLTCEVRRLSTFLADERLGRVDLLKIDVERAELDVLSGIDEADWPRLRQLAVELHDGANRRDETARMLRERGFAVTVDQEPAMSGTGVHMLYATRS